MSKGLIFAIIIIIVLLGLYFFTRGPVQAPSDGLGETEMIEEVSNDDGVDTLQEELDATKLDDIDQELNDVEGEIEGTLAE